MTKGKKTAKEKLKEEKPTWLKLNEKEVEAIILKLAKQGLTSEKIGIVLRDTYGVPKTKLFGKSISKILKENKIYKDADLLNIEKKQQALKQHLEKNKQDKKSRRALTIMIARASKLKKYKKRQNAGQD